MADGALLASQSIPMICLSAKEPNKIDTMFMHRHGSEHRKQQLQPEQQNQNRAYRPDTTFAPPSGSIMEAVLTCGSALQGPNPSESQSYFAFRRLLYLLCFDNCQASCNAQPLEHALQ